MVQRETVSAVFQDLKTLRDELKRNRENPHMIRICENLMKLTSLGEKDEAAELEAAAEAESSKVIEMVKKSAVDCEHKATDIYGRCVECKECQHTNTRSGVCLTCDADLTGETATGETQAQAGS
jgi:hypothetical protein